MPTFAPIKIVISGVDRFSKKFDKVNKRINKVGSSMRKAGSAMSMGVTLPIVGAGIALIRTAANFDLAMNKVEARGSEATKTFKDLRNQAKLLGATTQFSAGQAAGAMEKLSMAGWDTDQIYAGLPDVLNLAAAADIDLARAADITSNVMGTFGKKASEVGEIADIMAVATSSANIDMEMLAQTIEDSGSTAHQFGASLKDVAIGAGFLGNMGIQGTKAATVLKNMFGKITSGAPKVTNTFKALGINIEDGQGGLKGYADILGELSSKMVGMSKLKKARIMEDIFGLRVKGSVGAMANAIGRSDKGLAKLHKAMGTTTGTAKKMADIINKGATGGMRAFMSALEGVAIAIGESGILDMFSKFVRSLAKLLRKMSQVSPGLLKMGVLFLGLLATVGPLILIGIKLVVMFAGITAAIAKAGGVVALLSNPIGWIIAGVIALTGVLIYLTRNFDKSSGKIMTAILPLFGPVGLLLVGVAWVIKRWKKIAPFFRLVGMAISSVFKWMVKDSWVGKFFSWIFGMFEGLGEKMQWLADSGLAILTKITGKVVGAERMRRAGFEGYGGSASGASAGSSAAAKVRDQIDVKQEVKVKVDINGRNMGGAAISSEDPGVNVTDMGSIGLGDGGL